VEIPQIENMGIVWGLLASLFFITKLLSKLLSTESYFSKPNFFPKLLKMACGQGAHLKAFYELSKYQAV
jgi:hypothetical protein